MIIRSARFNTYLLATALAALLAGCGTTSSKSDKEIATLRVHLEVGREAGDRGEPVVISRTARITMNVDKNPILNESLVKEAQVVDSMGGFSLVIQFDQSGTMLLENFSATNPGKHLAIMAQFGEKEKAQTRWLAAPQINHRIANGVLNFVPDATRAEAEEIARGLNNVAIKNGNQVKPKTKDKEKAKTS